MEGFRFSELKSDKQAEIDGVWTDYAPGFRVKIARMNNPEFEKALRRIRRPYLRRMRRGEISEDVAEMIMRQAVAETILLGWEGLVDDDDKPIIYSKEKALELLSESREFFNEVFDMSRDAAIFREELQEEAEKNL